jgi:DNA (cytosine-5)-methyltransferase 1
LKKHPELARPLQRRRRRNTRPARRIGYHFIQADVLSLDLAFLQTFDLIPSSPPCQALSSMRHVHNALPHLNLIPATRGLLKASGRP